MAEDEDLVLSAHQYLICNPLRKKLQVTIFSSQSRSPISIALCDVPS
jgi:hypothetical protein